MNRIGREVFRAGFESGFNSGDNGPGDYESDKIHKRKVELLKQSGRSPIRAGDLVARIEKIVTGKTAEQKALIERYTEVLKTLNVIGGHTQTTQELITAECKVLAASKKYSNVDLIKKEISAIRSNFEDELKKKLEQELSISVDSSTREQ